VAGVDEIQPPLAWYDSAAVVVGEARAGRFSVRFVNCARSRATAHGQTRAAFTLVNGSSAVDRTGLLLQTGDRSGWLRGGALAEARAGTGLLGRRGQHVWFVELGRRRAEHSFAGTFSERGAANTTRRESEFVDLSGGTRPPYPGFEEAAHGETGALAWTWEHASGSSR